MCVFNPHSVPVPAWDIDYSLASSGSQCYYEFERYRFIAIFLYGEEEADESTELNRVKSRAQSCYALML